MKTGVTKLQAFSVDFVIRMMPFMYGVLWGCFAAVFFNATDASGDTLRAFVAVLTALTGAGLGLWGSRTLAERTAQRDRHQRIFNDILRVEGLRHATERYLTFLTVIAETAGDSARQKVKNATDKQLTSAGTALLALMPEYEDVPSFADVIESENDRRHAQRIKGGYRWMRRFFQEYSDTVDSRDARDAELARCLADSAIVSLKNLEKALAISGKYFQDRLDSMRKA